MRIRAASWPAVRWGASASTWSTTRPDYETAISSAVDWIERHPDLDWSAVDDAVYGCANQAGEDNRNVARMSSLLAGLPQEVPACTINRLCGSGLNAVGSAAASIRAGEGHLMIGGGVGPVIVGGVVSATGSYTAGLLSLTGLCGVAAVVMFTLGRMTDSFTSVRLPGSPRGDGRMLRAMSMTSLS